MTSRMLLTAMVRFWYVTLAGVLLTVAAVLASQNSPGVYWTQFDVVLLPPAEPLYPNRLESPPFDMTSMAGVMVVQFNGGVAPQRTSSSDTTLYGEGVRDGSRVRLRDNGTQWSTLFNVPVIDVQVVGRSEQSVNRQAARITSRLRTILTQRQDQLGIQRAARITLTTAPTPPAVTHVVGSRSRAVLAIGLTGAALTTVALGWLERRRRRRATTQLQSVDQLQAPSYSGSRT